MTPDSGEYGVGYDWNNTDGRLDYGNGNVSLDPELTPFLAFAENIVTVFVVYQIQDYWSSTGVPINTLGFNPNRGNTAPATQTIWAFAEVSSFARYPNPDHIDAYLNNIAHEIGHCLRISTRNYAGHPEGQNFQHDGGMWPTRYRATGLMRPNDPQNDPNGVWIRNEDWLRVNLSGFIISSGSIP